MSDGQIPHVRGDGDLAHELAIPQHLRPRHDPVDLDLAHVRRALDDLGQLLERRVLHAQLEDEPVELRLGQGVRALHLDRVLGREHEEGRRQRIGRARHGDAALLHAFEQRRLRLRRRAIHLVGEEDVAEDRPALELELLPSCRVLDDHVGADDVARHEVGRELDAREREVEALGERLDEQGLAEARARPRAARDRPRRARSGRA